MPTKIILNPNASCRKAGKIHSSFLRVRIQPGSPVHSAGELFTLNTRELNYSIEPAKIAMIVSG